jgi:Fe-S-cluster-containing dehydrogenase component
MIQKWGLVVNLERCIGCFACEVACKQEHDLPPGEKYIRVTTLGPHELDGELAMDFVPMATDGCDFCEMRLSAGKRPACVAVCPTHALGLYHSEATLHLLRGDRRFQICKLNLWPASIG